MIDALVLLGENRFGRSMSVVDAIGAANRHGISHLVAAPARPRAYHLPPANDALAAWAAASDGRIVPLARVDPLEGASAVREVVRCLGTLGMAGVFLHPAEEHAGVDQSAAVVEVAADLGVPIVIAAGHPGLSEALQIAEIAKAHPAARVVMTSGGQTDIAGLGLQSAWYALREADNLYVLTNGQYRQDFIEGLAAWNGARVMYASFAPVFDFDFEVQRILGAQMSPDARQAIQSGTARTLFGIVSLDRKEA